MREERVQRAQAADQHQFHVASAGTMGGGAERRHFLRRGKAERVHSGLPGLRAGGYRLPMEITLGFRCAEIAVARHSDSVPYQQREKSSRQARLTLLPEASETRTASDSRARSLERRKSRRTIARARSRRTAI